MKLKPFNFGVIFLMPLDYLCIKHLMDVMDVMLVERQNPWELFDHSIDAINTTLGTFVFAVF